MKIFLWIGLVLMTTESLQAKAAERLVWPAAPDPARIEYLSAVTTAKDIGIKKGFFSKISDFLFGDEEKGLNAPFGIHADAQKVYVTDIGAKTVTVFDKKEEEVITIEGPKEKRFLYPVDVVSDSKGNIYVSDSVLAKVYVFDSDGDFIRTIAPKMLQRPVGIAISADGKRLYIVDALASQIHMTTLEGKYVRSIGRKGSGQGEFNRPTYIDVGIDGKIYLSDSMNHCIQVLDSEGNFIRTFGHLSKNIGGFGSPRGIAIDSDGNIYVSDTLFNVIQIFNPDGQLLMLFGQYGSERGAFALPVDISILPDNTIFVSDTNNRRFQLFKRLDPPKARR